MWLDDVRAAIHELAVELDFEPPPAHSCPHAHRFPGFQANGASCWTELVVKENTWSKSLRQKTQRAMRLWLEWAECSDELWINVTTTLAFVAYHESLSMRENGSELNSGEFLDLIDCLKYIFEIQFAAASAILDSDQCEASVRPHLRCALAHLIEEPHSIVASLRAAKAKSLDPGVHDKHYANLLRTSDALCITEAQARLVSLYFIKNSGTRNAWGAHELQAWNLGLTLGTRNQSEVYPAKLWQLATGT